MQSLIKNGSTNTQLLLLHSLILPQDLGAIHDFSKMLSPEQDPCIS